MWDPFQREVLDALGLTPYRQRGPAEVAAQADPMASAGGSRPPPAGQAQGGLLDSIARAAGMAPDRLLIALPDLPPPQSLRGDAAAKRAVWPQLRRLRAWSREQ